MLAFGIFVVAYIGWLIYYICMLITFSNYLYGDTGDFTYREQL